MTRINVEYIYPPIPLRDFDWRATDDSYEPGCLIGYGPTKDRAVSDLLDQAVWLGLITRPSARRL